jgi:hypothetical protein
MNAEEIVDRVLAAPIAELTGPAVELLQSAAQAVAVDALAARIAGVLGRLPRERLGRSLPPPLVEAARAVAELDWRVPRALTLRLLGRGPVRRLLRGQVLRALVDFTRRFAAPFTDNALARGLGKAFGKTPIKGVAEGFADTAVDEVIEGIATELADPKRAREQAGIRVAILDALLEETGSDLAALVAPQVAALLAAARRALAAWAPRLAADPRAALALVFGSDLDRSLGDLLAEVGLREVVRAHAVRWLARD